MANDVNAMYTINNATIFLVVTAHLLAVLIFLVKVMSVTTVRGDTHIDTSRALCGTSWDSTGVDQFPCRTCCFSWLPCHSVTDTWRDTLRGQSGILYPCKF